MPDHTYNDALDQYRALVAGEMSETLKGKANPYTSMNGNMFSFLAKDGAICLRLSDADRQDFLDRFGGGPVMQYGAVMKGYVALTDKVMENAELRRVWAAKCMENARALPPKPTKAKK